ncbi:hypothetical protein AX15_003462 [Amanita polypyramis BW_CC]|nr:hypothetical protein AX15_003462 [Amanita polypyramis BW_CC]
MATRVFAVIIGIDKYKSRSILNLHSCASDAKKIGRWLVDDLGIPKEHICQLLDSEATKSKVEDTIMQHLVNNPDIERGDAIFIYFAGHGSQLSAPVDWFQDNQPGGFVDILCTYDHNTKNSSGRILGISDRSMHALLRELAEVKGDNITLVLDCCFSPLQGQTSNRERRHARWTSTNEAQPDDLYQGLWPGARGNPYAKGSGFCEFHPQTHTLLAACEQGGKATEGRGGGCFTSAFLKIATNVALHRTSYARLHDLLVQELSGAQMPVCHSSNKSRIIFDTIPFVADGQFVPVRLEGLSELYVGAGAAHGITAGTEFTIHLHNYRGSNNPSLTTAHVVEVNPTWCVSRLQCKEVSVPKNTWARLSRLNNSTPFKVKLKVTLTSLFRYLKLRRSLPTKADKATSSHLGTTIVRVDDKSQADISLSIDRHDIVVDRHDQLLSTVCLGRVKIDRKSGVDVINDAARFHFKIHSENPEHPLENLVVMELYSLDPLTWSRTEPNLLVNGRATIDRDQSAMFTAVIQNKSNYDLWPYLFFMDSNCYGITILYHPDPTLSIAPLSRHSSLHVGSGKPGSESLMFALADQNLDSGFLKLFLTTSPVPMNMIEQGPTEEWFHSANYLETFSPSFYDDEIWDTSLACLSFVKDDRC